MPFTLPTSTIVSKTGQYNVTVNDQVVLADGTFSVFLYTAAGNLGRSVTIKNIGSGTITVDGENAETIDGAATYSLPTTAAVTLISDGANWRTLTSVTLTANNATYFGGQLPAYYTNASNISSGTLPVARLSGTATNLTANNATYAFGKSEGGINANAATYLNGKTEGNLNVNAATYGTYATYLNSKTEGNLNVNAAAQLSGALSGLTVNGTISANGYLRTDTTNGRMILPVGANKYAT